MFRFIPIPFLLAILSISACAPSSGQTIRIDAPTEFIQNPLWGYKQIMFDLGYEHLGLVDPKIGHIVPVVEQYGEYRMLFTASDDPDLRVSVHIRERDGKGEIHLYRKGKQELDNRGMEHYRALTDRLTQQFGKGNVHFD